MALESRNKAQVAREFGIHRSLVYTWIDQFKGEDNKLEISIDRTSKVQQLEAEISRLKEENKILRKAIGVISSQCVCPKNRLNPVYITKRLPRSTGRSLFLEPMVRLIVPQT